MQLNKGEQRVLVIPDLQAPFHHPDSLEFLASVYDGAGCDTVVCIGDSLDLHGLGRYTKDPSGMGALHEIEVGRAFLRELYDTFPVGTEVTSNHNSRLSRTAFEAGIPEELVIAQRELQQAPEEWDFCKRVEIDGVLYTHGEEYGGMYGFRRALDITGRSVVFGHTHSAGGVAYKSIHGKMIFGMNVGCLIDFDAYAFNYARTSRYLPTLGCGVVLEGVPYFIPMFVDEDNRWTGTVVL